MGKQKSKSTQTNELVAFLTDLEGRQEGIRPFDTKGPQGKEAMGGAPGLAHYVGMRDAGKNGVELQNGEINPFVFSASAKGGEKPTKKMYEFWRSDTAPVLPKAMRDQYDVVFAGSQPFDPSQEVYNSKFGYNLADKTENVWRFVRKTQNPVSDELEEEGVLSNYSSQHDSDRPVTVGTLSYTNPDSFLSSYIRSTGSPLLS